MLILGRMAELETAVSGGNTQHVEDLDEICLQELAPFMFILE